MGRVVGATASSLLSGLVSSFFLRQLRLSASLMQLSTALLMQLSTVELTL